MCSYLSPENGVGGQRLRENSEIVYNVMLDWRNKMYYSNVFKKCFPRFAGSLKQAATHKQVSGETVKTI